MFWLVERLWEPSRARSFLLASTPLRRSCGDTQDMLSSLVCSPAYCFPASLLTGMHVLHYLDEG